MQNLIDEFTAALDAHTLEYKRRLDLWRERKLDIMELRCDEQNRRIIETRQALEDALFGGVIFAGGNDAVLTAARKYIDAR